jgi:protein O-mannosyl-transferase
MPAKRIYAAVGLCAVVVYLGALANQFAVDDLYIIVYNPVVHSISGLWRAFVTPYWPPELGGKLYRPLAVASYTLDGLAGNAPWFHAVNLLWHAGASVAVAALARRWSGSAAALVAGLVFAVHPVHVEAVANAIGRAELMAATFAGLSVYAALVTDRLGWSALALVGGLLSKENAAVVPALVAWGWMVGLSRPPRRRMAAYAATWLAIALVYGCVRWAVLHPYGRIHDLAPVFVGASPVAVRLTAVSALTDVARLLVFPLTLRVDYGPAERTLVTSPLDPHFLLGCLCLGLWAVLLWRAWRARRTVETYALGWIALAFLPVANLLFPVGVLVAERTLYLPSVGVALAAGAALRDLAGRRLVWAAALIVLAGGARTVARVPVWHDDKSVTLSILEDSPGSYEGPARTGALFQGARRPDQALAAFDQALTKFGGDAAVYVAAADAAFTLGRPQLADSLLRRSQQLCFRCDGMYVTQARAARSRGDSASADSLLAHLGRP